MTDQTAHRITELAAGVFGVDSSSLSLATTSDEVESWDSFAQLNLMVAIEDEFGLELDPEEIGNMYHLGGLVEHVAERLQS